MNELLHLFTTNTGALGIGTIIARILASALFSSVIYLSYWYTHATAAYSKKFNVSLMTMAVLTGTVMTVTGNNVALSLGMLGALSIVRFRTAIKDSRDTMYIFWSIIVGICCGVGDYLVAFIGSVTVFLLLLFFGRFRNENRMLLIIRGAKDRSAGIEQAVFEYFENKALLKVKNTTANSCEYIYEMNRRTYDLSLEKNLDITDRLYALGEIEYVNLIAQSDEITG